MTTTAAVAKTVRAALKAAGIKASVRAAGEWIDVELLTTTSAAAIEAAYSVALPIRGVYEVCVSGLDGVCGEAA